MMKITSLDADVGISLSGSNTLQDILQQCAEALVRHLDAALVRVWMLNISDNVLELQASAGMYTHIDGSHNRIPIDKLQPGLISQELKPYLTNDIRGDSRFYDQEWAALEGMTAFANYPLIVEEQAVGVIEIFAYRPLPENTLKAMALAANVIDLDIQRKWTDPLLKKSVEELEKLNRLKDDFLSTVSYELLTPLTNMKMAIHMLKTASDAQAALAVSGDFGN